MAIEVGCPLKAVNFCPIPASRERSPANYFIGGCSAPTAPTQYSSVHEFCEFLRTLAVLNGDHTIRRTWVDCLRGAAHFWFYHTLSMGTRKYLADAHISEVTDALTSEFGSDQYTSSHSPQAMFVYSSEPHRSDSGYEMYSQKAQTLGTAPVNGAAGVAADPAADIPHTIVAAPHSSNVTLSVRPASASASRPPKPPSYRPSSLPPSYQSGQPSGDRDVERLDLGRRNPSHSPQSRGRRRGSRNPRTPVCDNGTPLLSQAFHQQVEMIDSHYPTHKDTVRQQEAGQQEAAHTTGNVNGHANGHANRHTDCNGNAGGKASSEREARPKVDQDLLMVDAPRTPRQKRSHKPATPDKGRSAICKPKSTPKRLTTRNADANELVSIVEMSSTRRTRSSSA